MTDTKTATETRTVTAVLQADHERLDTLLERARLAADGGAAGDAGDAFGRFRSGLEHHIDVEEQVLFPAFEQRTGIVSGPTQVMRMEHQSIRSALDEGTAALAKQDTGAFTEVAASLERLLGDHNAKEENMLYPMADRSLERADLAGVVSRFDG